MARPSPFLLRFFALSLLLPAALAVVGWIYFDDVRAKSFYFRLASSGLMAHLDGGELAWDGDSLRLALATRDTVITSADFSRQRFNQASFDIRTASGEALALGVPFAELAPHTKRVMRKIPELGLREMRSPAPGQLQFRLGRTGWLHWSASAAPAGVLDSPGVRRLDPHWYVVTQRTRQADR